LRLVNLPLKIACLCVAQIDTITLQLIRHPSLIFQDQTLLNKREPEVRV